MGPIRQAASDGDDLYLEVVTTDIVANLLQAAHHGKVGDRVRENGLAFQSQSSGDASHVLLGDPGIQIAIRKAVRKLLQHRIPEIATDQPDRRIVLSQLAELINK